MEWLPTDQRKPGRVDGFVIRTGQIYAVGEVKRRYLSRDAFSRRFNDEYLISANKIWDGRSCAKLTGSPFYIFVVLDDFLIAFKVCDDRGNLVCPLKIENRQTQRCVNGGLKQDEVCVIKIPQKNFYDTSNT